MLAVVAEGPAVKGTVLYRGHIVRHQVATDFVAFVDRGPKRPGHRFPSETDRVAQPGGENPMLPGARIDLPDGGAARLGFHAVVADVAVRTDRHVKVLAIRTRDDILRPVMIDRSAR